MTTTDDLARLQHLADEVRSLFKDETTEPQRMRAAGALLDLMLTMVIDFRRLADCVERLADTFTPAELAHLQLSISKLADATEVIAEIQRRSGAH